MIILAIIICLSSVVVIVFTLAEVAIKYLDEKFNGPSE